MYVDIAWIRGSKGVPGKPVDKPKASTGRLAVALACASISHASPYSPSKGCTATKSSAEQEQGPHAHCHRQPPSTPTRSLPPKPLQCMSCQSASLPRLSCPPGDQQNPSLSQRSSLIHERVKSDQPKCAGHSLGPSGSGGRECRPLYQPRRSLSRLLKINTTHNKHPPRG